jgi:integrase
MFEGVAWCSPGASLANWDVMTMAEKLTRARVDAFVAAGVPDGKSEVILWDGVLTGLGLRLRLSGNVSWLFQYRAKGGGRDAPSRKLTIGGWPSVSIDAARAAARIHAGGVATGSDPAVARKVERERTRNLLGKVVDAYIGSLVQRQIVNRALIASVLYRGLGPLMGREIDSLTRRDFVRLVDAIAADGRPGAAAELRKHMRALLEFAVTKGSAKFNCLAGMRKPRSSRAEKLEETGKAKALSDVELAALWASAASLGSFGALIRFGLLSGLRRAELSGLTWEAVLDDRVVIHAEHAKTGVTDEVPLTGFMREILAAQPRTSRYVFSGRRARMGGWSKLVPKARGVSGVQFKLHDLRRTCRTIMSRCGVPEDIAELAIGHVRTGLLATYNLDQAWQGRIAAFEKVSAHIGNNVKPPRLAIVT